MKHINYNEVVTVMLALEDRKEALQARRDSIKNVMTSEDNGTIYKAFTIIVDDCDYQIKQIDDILTRFEGR